MYEHFAALLGRGTTYQRDIEKVGSHFFGNHWGGVFARNTMPRISTEHLVYIANTDRAGGPGVHWLAVMDQDGDRFMNDPLGSVGSRQRRELERLHPNAKWAEMDAEQDPKEADCAVRALTALAIGLHCGVQDFLAL